VPLEVSGEEFGATPVVCQLAGSEVAIAAQDSPDVLDLRK
jgi:hypothetical protein